MAALFQLNQCKITSIRSFLRHILVVILPHFCRDICDWAIFYLKHVKKRERKRRGESGLSRLRGGLVVGRPEAIGIDCEEIAVEHDTDTPQELGVDGAFLEEPVDIGAVEVDLTGEPCHAAFLGIELFLYKETDGLHGAGEITPRHIAIEEKDCMVVGNDCL